MVIYALLHLCLDLDLEAKFYVVGKRYGSIYCKRYILSFHQDPEDQRDSLFSQHIYLMYPYPTSNPMNPYSFWHKNVR